MSETILLPCPFCGTQPELTRHGNEFTKKRHVEVTCPKCYVKRAIGAVHNTLEWCQQKSIEAWNRRTPPVMPKTVVQEQAADYQTIHASMNC